MLCTSNGTHLLKIKAYVELSFDASESCHLGKHMLFKYFKCWPCEQWWIESECFNLIQ